MWEAPYSVVKMSNNVFFSQNFYKIERIIGLKVGVKILIPQEPSVLIVGVSDFALLPHDARHDVCCLLRQ